MLRMTDDIMMDEYQAGAGITAIYPGKGTIVGLMYAALGLGESGEVQGKVKKILRDSNGIMTAEALVKIKAELGDLLWYVAAVASELNVTLGEIARENLQKLADRQARGKIQGEGDSR